MRSGYAGDDRFFVTVTVYPSLPLTCQPSPVSLPEIWADCGLPLGYEQTALVVTAQNALCGASRSPLRKVSVQILAPILFVTPYSSNILLLQSISGTKWHLGH